jgi:hypothetical protein
MTSSPKSLSIKPIQGDFEEAAAAETVAEGMEALALTITDNENNPDFTYSATAEDALNQTAEADYTGALDGQPGITYNGPAGMFNHLRVAVSDLDLLEGTIAPEAADSVVPVLLVNSDIVAYFDSEDARASNGGFVSEVDTAIAVEYHIDTIVQVQNGDVIRVGLVGGGEETADWDVAEGGDFVIT